jgi:transcriptional regulator with XRE-family HTH domain
MNFLSSTHPNPFYSEAWERYRDPVAFVARVQARMKRHRVSQAALARRAGFQEPAVSRWLGGNPSRKPSMETMLIIDETLDLIIEEGRHDEA